MLLKVFVKVSGKTGAVVAVVTRALVDLVLPVRRVVGTIWSVIRTSCLVEALTATRTAVFRAARVKGISRVARVLVVADTM